MGNASVREMTNGPDSPAERADGGDCPMPVAREIRPPESPRRSRTPFLLTPQMPVSPLPRQAQHQQADTPAVPTSTWPTDSDASEKGIPTLLTWTLGGNSVLIEGSWDNWSSRKALHKSGKDHSILLVLPSGVFHYKYIVDGELRYVPDLPYVKDEAGQVSNILDVHDFIPESLDSVSGFEAPPSPESSYTRHFPTEEDFTKDAPLLPSQLLDSVLKTDELSLAKPQHVVLNHLFLEKGLSQRSLLALSLSQRFRSKYVTVVLYKPIKR
ncbi:hypothetical protein LUZ60_011130 [Juncus effusus]|nr:hypothetical protein LUZ60_011130 [Juncus effusus]